MRITVEAAKIAQETSMACRTGQKYFVQKTRLVWKNQAGKHTRTTIFEHMLQKSNISKENKTYSKIRLVQK